MEGQLGGLWRTPVFLLCQGQRLPPSRQCPQCPVPPRCPPLPGQRKLLRGSSRAWVLVFLTRRCPLSLLPPHPQRLLKPRSSAAFSLNPARPAFCRCHRGGRAGEAAPQGHSALAQRSLPTPPAADAAGFLIFSPCRPLFIKHNTHQRTASRNLVETAGLCWQ